MLSRGTRRSVLGTLPGAARTPTSAAAAASSIPWPPAAASLWRLPRQGRCKASTAPAKSKSAFVETTPLAEQLGATGLWTSSRRADRDATKAKTKATATATATAAAPASKAKKAAVKGDKHRVNIVSAPLVDDVLGYMGGALAARHTGCDLIDIYPGAGLWSSRLHELLRPRTHLLLEPDEGLYAPFLQPLLARPGVALVPKSGIIWRELSDVLDSRFPHQAAAAEPAGGIAEQQQQQRNDTLLVTANLAFFPKRRYAQFDSLTHLVLFQFINSIRASSLFHRYGLVRMLVWVEAADRNALLAKSCQRRRRLAVEGELATDWITEVAGPDDYSQWFVRDERLDRASCQQALARMAAAGIAIPAGRATQMAQQVQAAQKQAQKELAKQQRRAKRASKASEAGAKGEKGAKAVKERAGSVGDADAPKAAADASAAADPEDDLGGPSTHARPYREELRALEAEDAAGLLAPKTAAHDRMMTLKYRANREAKVSARVHELLQQREALAADYEAAAATADVAAQDGLAQAAARWNDACNVLSPNTRNELLLVRDNRHLFRQAPPVLAWDRRAVEPLVARATEFFPNAPCALLDIQPKAVHPLLRVGRADKAGDMFELILRAMSAMGAKPVSKAIESVWPGAAEGVLPHCPSLRDRSRGGHPVGGPYSELSARTLNETQWTEIMEAWMKWPFRPTLPQLVSRIDEEADADDDEVLG